MTLPRFVLRYTAVPFLALVLVSTWAVRRESSEVDARQYAALVVAFPSMPADLRDATAEAMRGGQMGKTDYADLVRRTLARGIILDWPAVPETDVARQRARLLVLLHESGRNESTQ
ncbi:hypothetical protein [Chitinasiproducens palmae]|uniref:Uncharacterized protein n=1 Tax=Chitinasiproducens palmae TaxID=1770053 RepID=A0A1H2PK74_9BURK|nr:hypothetical protein [Chitinasiproducens palmae]SDV46695.1 hypothetical protein SAMN05216551_101553 [Chitinasiproducens palmae]